MKFFGRIINPDAAKKSAARIQKKADMASKIALFQVASAVHERAIRLLNDNSDGPTMHRYNPNRDVNVSLPGDPPNTDTGRAVQSIRMEFENDAKTAIIGTNLKYLVWLQFGTLKTAARPWLDVAFKMETGNAVKLFKDIYGKEK